MPEVFCSIFHPRIVGHFCACTLLSPRSVRRGASIERGRGICPRNRSPKFPRPGSEGLIVGVVIGGPDEPRWGSAIVFEVAHVVPCPESSAYSSLVAGDAQPKASLLRLARSRCRVSL
jgi:hypothetical protein